MSFSTLPGDTPSFHEFNVNVVFASIMAKTVFFFLLLNFWSDGVFSHYARRLRKGSQNRVNINRLFLLQKERKYDLIENRLRKVASKSSIRVIKIPGLLQADGVC